MALIFSKNRKKMRIFPKKTVTNRPLDYTYIVSDEKFISGLVYLSRASSSYGRFDDVNTAGQKHRVKLFFLPSGS